MELNVCENKAQLDVEACILKYIWTKYSNWYSTISLGGKQNGKQNLIIVNEGQEAKWKQHLLQWNEPSLCNSSFKLRVEKTSQEALVKRI